MPNLLAPHAAALEGQAPSGAQLHIYLHRLCEERVAAVRDLFREPTSRQDILSRCQALRVSAESGVPLHEIVCQKIIGSLGEPTRLLPWCVTGLLALDRHHWHYERLVVQYNVQVLPLHLGGFRGWLLPLADEPFSDLIAEHQKTPERGEGDYGPDLRSLLGLNWRVVGGAALGVDLVVDRLDDRVAMVLESRLPDLRVGLASPFRGLQYTFASRPALKSATRGTPYRFVAVHDNHRAAAREALDGLLQRCRSMNIDVLCLPELCLDEALLADFRLMLARSGAGRWPALVIAGSTHAGEAPDCWNRALVLDWAGNEIWRHDKCACFRITPGEAAALPEALREAMGIDLDGGEEDIQLGTEVVLRDGPLGRMGVVICLDLLNARLRRALVEAGATCVFVPAMSSSTSLFETAADELRREARTSSFIANSGWLVGLLDATHREKVAVAMAFLPARGGRAWRGMDNDLHLFTSRELISADTVVK